MKKFKCDICGLETSSDYELFNLDKQSSPNEIKHACSACFRTIKSADLRMEKILYSIKASWLKKVILKLKITLTPENKKSGVK